MPAQSQEPVFINLPVNDVEKSRAFFSALGYEFEDLFSDENAVSVKIGKDVFAMLLQRDFFARFTTREIADAHQSSEVLVAVSLPSRETVNEFVDKAISLGGTAMHEEDHGVMYSRSYADLDGHIWEVGYMDVEAFKQAAQK